MNYSLYKLAFDTAVHFGASDSAQSLYVSDDHFCADTLFSALCHSALSLRGPAGLEMLCGAVRAGRLLLSDSMPWRGETLYLPKPFTAAEAEQIVPSDKRKALKRLKWLPLDQFSAYAAYVRGGAAYDPERAHAEFGVNVGTAKVKIVPGEDTLPYQVGLYYFKENTGLWFLAGWEDEAQAELLGVLLEGLSLSGIGGKTGAGYGKFHVAESVLLRASSDPAARWLLSALDNVKAPRQMLLSTSLPSDAELEALLPGAEYMLTRRAGFVRSASYAPESRKKSSQVFLSAGSVLPGRFAPALYEVGEAGRHPVYRLSAPLFLGVEL